ncbi:MAG: urease accessory UreF family protein [Actinomycetota bacterium]
MDTVDLAVAAILADGRFPAGGHAHSAGFEAATALTDLTEATAFDAFLRGRLTTTGSTEAHLLAAIGHGLESASIDWSTADAEIEARIVSPALREVSRTLGRQWVRAARAVWPSPAVEAAASCHPAGPHQVAAVAATFRAAGLGLAAGVTLHLHHLAATVTTAAVRLHGLDPYEAQRRHLGTAAIRASIVDSAVAHAADPWPDLPAWSGPLTEICAEAHASADGRLFQS